jgi:hypothetical protein
MAAEPVPRWPEQSLELCLHLLRKIRADAAKMPKTLESILAEGVEARSFAAEYRPFLILVDETIANVNALREQLSPAEDRASASISAELGLLAQEYEAFRDHLAKALSRASEPAGPVDWERIRAAEEAHARGKTKPFTRR